MREIINFNTNWQFFKEWNDGIKTEKLNGEIVTLPHTVAEIPLHYFDESDTWLITGYQNIFNYDNDEKTSNLDVGVDNLVRCVSKK